MSAAWGSTAKMESLRYSRLMMYAWSIVTVPAVILLTYYLTRVK